MMRWPWAKGDRFRDHQAAAAEEALLVARISYEDTLGLKSVVQEIGEEHRRLQRENHFSEKIRRAYFEGR
jgi:hypothetical protein